MVDNSIWKKISLAALIIVTALLLGSLTTSEYVSARGFDFLEQDYQIKRHLAVLEGHAGNPWQYRVLAPFLVSIVIDLFKHLNIPHYIGNSFVFFRYIQDITIMLLSYAYYRKFGLSLLYALLGMVLLAWGMSYSHYDTDLSFNTFFDIIFYLLAGLCILYRKIVWIVPITLLAALNRETSVLIPFLLLSVFIFVLPKGSTRKVMPVFITAVFVYVAIFVVLRLSYGSQVLFLPYGHHPGLDLLQYNLFRTVTWQKLVATLSIIPIVAIIGYYKWPLQLKLYFWVIVPVWLIIHAFVSVMAETRLYLVPQALVFIPGALLTLAKQSPASDCVLASARRELPRA